MNFRKDHPVEGFTKESVDLLVKALPWIKNTTGKTIVIKYGGSVMVDDALRREVINDIVLLKIIGVNPVIVHGGGKEISKEMERSGIPVEFKSGQRVTNDEGMDVVKKVLYGKVNQEIVEAFNEHGNLAVGISGVDAGTIIAEPKNAELGHVGRVLRINGGYLLDVIKADYIPVIATIAMGEERGFFNVNADMAAGHIAAAIGAHKIMFLTDVEGLYRDFSDKETLLSNITLEEARQMVAKEEITQGMIPKLESCIHALENGVHRAHIVNGTTPHVLLLEVLTDTGVGTMIAGEGEFNIKDGQPFGSFASKLLQNLIIHNRNSIV